MKKPFYVTFEVPDSLLQYVYQFVDEVKRDGKILKGTDQTTKAVINRTAKLVLIAEDVDPPEVVAHLPVLCEEVRIPYVFIPTSRKLGEILELEFIGVGSACIVDADRNASYLVNIIMQLAAIRHEKDQPLPFEVKINPIFKGRNFQVERGLCFVMIPFREPFFRLFENQIKPTLEKLGFRVIKANDIFTPTAIIEDIWECVNKASLIIADVTNRNPNVYYELGIAHTIGKDAIIITQNDDDIPFDLKHLRYFKYTDNQEGWMALEKNLIRIIFAIRMKGQES